MRALLVLLSALPLCAQPVRYQHGDDPRWADPKFDDATWPIVRNGSFPAPPRPGDGIVWIRQRMSVPATGAALWLRLVRYNWEPNLPEELRVDGQLIGSTAGQRVHEVVFDLPAAAGAREVLVARRIWVPAGLRGVDQLLSPLEIGSRDAIRLAALRARNRTLRDEALLILQALLQVAAGFGLLFAWRGTRATPDVLWFAVNLTAWSLQSLWFYLTPFLWPELSFGGYTLANVAMEALTNLALWCFTWAILSPPVRWPLYLFTGAQIAFPIWRGHVLTAATPNVWQDYEVVNFCSSGLDLLAALLTLALAVWRWPQDGERRWMAAGLVAFRFTLALTDFEWFPQEWPVLGFTLSLQDVSQTILLLSMAWMLSRRLRRTWRERQDLNTEFAAARDLQQSLVRRLPETPGFAVDSAYRPASQVGGDFYRVFPADEGAILVVVGDVSGKGLKAAMTVAGLVCAMEGIRTRAPGRFLAELNHAAKGFMPSGFATCCAALIGRSGEAVIANAGHPSPYLDGREAPVEAGLPLGVVDDLAYAESAARGDLFTFVSDGVVEAASVAGELFGFERTREISTKSAADVAEAARAWGQNDDITVVTVRRTPS